MMSPRTQSLAKASVNFGFLARHEPRLLETAAAAEKLVFADPVAALGRLRLFGEFLAQEAAAGVGLYTDPRGTQLELVHRLRDRGVLTRDVEAIFHDLRRKGNAANHEGAGTLSEALHRLRMARTLAVWFHRSYGNEPRFRAGAFVPPPDPSEADEQLRATLERQRAELIAARAQIGALSQSAEREAELRAKAERDCATAYADLDAALELAEESAEQAATAEAEHQARLAVHQAKAVATPHAQLAAVRDRALAAGEPELLDLDEAATRKLIDAQLRAVGWEVDSEVLSYSRGVRPTKGLDLAIAEWPTKTGPADYVLFAGLRPVAVVEAKRKRKDVVGAIEQAKRYSRGYVLREGELSPGGPWGEFHVPFLFATNGRPFLRQLETKSGIWFLDARRSTNHPRALTGWYAAQELTAILARDPVQAEAKLAAESTDYLGLRDYQLEAIRKVEAGIAEGRRELLLAMATGTGKTRTALGLIYRLLKSGTFRRVLFLVDRTALGEQALGVFKNVKLEQQQSLNEIYDVMGLEDPTPEQDTRLHVTTVQGMVRRLLMRDDIDEALSVGLYDCIIVDESHRGYNLDKEMGETALAYRSEHDYISKYRQVLDHFDAVRIGLTATPALHTKEIFGPPVFTYSYRQAVIDGYLVDHEPPIRIRTKLNQEGIHWAAGEEVMSYRAGSDQVDLFDTPDEIDIEVEGFNTKVITEAFNEVVCERVARDIDPQLPGKVMIFCATDAHADIVVTKLKAALTERYGEVEDDAVMKITGKADRPLQRLRRYKNERLPKVAVTVDLLTTGIDVPAIDTLVFIRRVRSRILYEQMLGRATRLCPEIGKEFFRIYDAVELYAALDKVSTMKPVVTRPRLDFATLAEELRTIDDEDHAAVVATEILVKFHQRKRWLEGESLTAFETLSGTDAAGFVALLRRQDQAELQTFFGAHPQLPTWLDKLRNPDAQPVLISDAEDELLSDERGYGEGRVKPADYLDDFGRYLDEHQNELPALIVVTQRPQELTRRQLRELSLALDAAGYPLSALRSAWAETRNQDVAASIVGFIRQRALGSPLVPYAQRVDRALAAVLRAHDFDRSQKMWLERIAAQLRREVIVDRAALDNGQFKVKAGGFGRLDKRFDGQLTQVLDELHTRLWEDAAG